MLLAPARFQRASFSCAAILLVAAITTWGFSSTGTAMLAQATFQDGRLLPLLSEEVPSVPGTFTPANLSRMEAAR